MRPLMAKTDLSTISKTQHPAQSLAQMSSQRLPVARRVNSTLSTSWDHFLLFSGVIHAMHLLPVHRRELFQDLIQKDLLLPAQGGTLKASSPWIPGELALTLPIL